MDSFKRYFVIAFIALRSQSWRLRAAWFRALWPLDNFVGGQEMDWSIITPAPLHPGWGKIYQSGAVDAGISAIPGPLLVVTMDSGELDEQYITHVKDHPGVIAELYIGINDSPDAVLPTHELLTHAVVGVSYLSAGVNVLSHCAAGISRSSYFTCALLRAADMKQFATFDKQLAFIRKGRNQANPNSGFAAHLRSLDIPEAT